MSMREIMAINAKSRLITTASVTAVVALSLKHEDYYWLVSRLRALEGYSIKAGMSVHDKYPHVANEAWRPCSIYFKFPDAEAIVVFVLEDEFAAAMKGRPILVAMAPEIRSDDEYRRLLDDATNFILTGTPPSTSLEEFFVYVWCLPIDVLTLHPNYTADYVR